MTERDLWHVTIIQSRWRARIARRQWVADKQAVIMIQGAFRRLLAFKRMAVLKSLQAKHEKQKAMQEARSSDRQWSKHDSMACSVWATTTAPLTGLSHRFGWRTARASQSGGRRRFSMTKIHRTTAMREGRRHLSFGSKCLVDP